MKRISIFALLFVFAAAVATADSERSMTVGKFPQRWPTKFTAADILSGGDVRSLSTFADTLLAGTDDGVAVFKSGVWMTRDAGFPGKSVPAMKDVSFVLKTRTGAAVGADNTLFLFESFPPLFVASAKLPAAVTAVAFADDGAALAVAFTGDGVALAGTRKGLFSVSAKGEVKCVKELCDTPITAIAADAGDVWVAAADGLYRITGGKAAKVPAGAKGPISDDIRALCVDQDGILWVGTAKGLVRHDSKTNEWKNITGPDGGLPYEDVLSLASGGGALWVGTAVGAARWDGAKWQYFQGGRYLLDDRIQAVAVDADGAAWLGTPKGVSRIKYKMWTLEEKAAYITKGLRARHVRHGQTAEAHLAVPGDLSTAVPFSSDNDGLWTGMYLAAECFRYAETRDPEAKRHARQGIELMMRLQDITERPGFIARSLALADEYVGEGGEWNHFTPDGKWKWKGDTSSDEVDGHFFAYAVYFDLCVESEQEKEEIKTHVHNLMSHIVDHDYYLTDTDGKPTSWGMWNPDYLSSGRGYFQRNLNALEILSCLKAAYHITGDEKFQEHYLKLGYDHKYFSYAVKQKLLAVTNHSDDELAFLAYYPILRYETDPKIREYLEKSVTRSWEIERPERSSLFNFIYAFSLGGPLDLEQSINTLKEMPPDMLDWAVRNTQRADIKMKLIKDRFDRYEAYDPLPRDERPTMKWNGNPYALDGGDGGRSEDDGGFYLLPYWMGRYYDFIVEESEAK